jgi:hypothetical protein
MVASLCRSPNDDQIGMIVIGNPYELLGRVPMRMDEGEFDIMLTRVPADLTAQLLRLIVHRLLDFSVGAGAGKSGGRSDRHGSRRWTHEHGDGAAAETLRFSAGPPEGIP